jgi:hypothetical protein
MLNRIVASLFVASFTPITVWAATESGHIREIRLSSGGLAEVVREAPVNASGVINLEVPLDQVDDILKSAVLLSDKASATGLSLVGPQPLSESFKGLPFGVDALSSVPALLTAIQGASVTVESNGKTVQGVVLGVEYRPGVEGVQHALLSLLTPTGTVATLELARDASVTIDDPALRAKLVQATAAIARAKNDRSRTIAIHVNGMKNDKVDLSYVVAAPIWKTAYKVVSDANGKARLQAWTVLENASGEDWDDIKIVLTSADPVTLTQPLHQWYWKNRTNVPVNTASAYVPSADTGNLSSRNQAKAIMAEAALATRSRSLAARPAAPMPSPASVANYGGAASSAEDRAVSNESDISATFELPGVFSVANGDTLSVPIVDVEIPASMVSLYRADSGVEHPVAAMMLENKAGVSLPPGILTVYDTKTGYVGDAQLSGIPVDDTRLASFATDRKVSITQDVKPVDEVIEAKFVDGLLRLTQKSRLVTSYVVTGALDGDRTVVIEHPIHAGWEFSSPNSDGKTSTHQRLKVALAKGEQKTVQAVDERLRRDTVSVADVSSDAFLNWSASSTNKALAAKLAQLADARKQEVEARAALGRWDEARERLESEQNRIRQNLGAVPANSDLATRYLKQLDNSENELRTLAGQRVALEENVVRVEGQVQQLLRAM